MTGTHDKKMVVLMGHEKTEPYLDHWWGKEKISEYFKLILFKAVCYGC